MYEFTEKQLKDLAYFQKNVMSFMSDDALRFRHLLISGEKIIKAFDGLDQAADYAVLHYEKGEYIIEQVIDENEIVNFM